MDGQVQQVYADRAFAASKVGVSTMLLGSGPFDGVTSAKRCRVPHNVLVQEVNGEVVLLNTDTGKYYGLNKVASRMWHLLLRHGQDEAVIQTLVDEYAVPGRRLREDLDQLMQQLVSARLLVPYVESSP